MWGLLLWKRRRLRPLHITNTSGHLERPHTLTGLFLRPSVGGGVVLGKEQGSRVLFHYSMDADLPPTQRPSHENNPHSSVSPALTGGILRREKSTCTFQDPGRTFTPRRTAAHLSDLLAQHGGAGVDDKHHILGDHREVFGGEVVDKVSV